MTKTTQTSAATQTTPMAGSLVSGTFSEFVPFEISERGVTGYVNAEFAATLRIKEGKVFIKTSDLNFDRDAGSEYPIDKGTVRVLKTAIENRLRPQGDANLKASYRAKLEALLAQPGARSQLLELVKGLEAFLAS